MSEPWMGLHNQHDHETTRTSTDWAWCDQCKGTCRPWRECRCCLAAEVEALRAQVQVLQARRACGMPYDQCRFSENDRRAMEGGGA